MSAVYLQLGAYVTYVLDSDEAFSDMLAKVVISNVNVLGARSHLGQHALPNYPQMSSVYGGCRTDHQELSFP